MRPNAPFLPTNEYKEASETKYSPGSPACYPSRLKSLPDLEAADERYRCETVAEKERLQSNDLVQQTRAADAAIATVNLTYRQMLIDLAGGIFGVLTLLAAGYAAWHARRANQIASQGDRPWLEIKNFNAADVSYSHAARRTYGRVWAEFEVKNAGKRPAVDLSYKIVGTNTFAQSEFELLDQNDFIARKGLAIPPNGSIFLRGLLEDSTPYEEATEEAAEVISLKPFRIAIGIRYRERESAEWKETQCSWMVGSKKGPNTSWVELELPSHPGSDEQSLEYSADPIEYRLMT